MSYGSFSCRGKEYDLSHLNTFDWNFKRKVKDNKRKGEFKELSFNFMVSFSNHVFTNGLKGADIGSDDLLYDRGGEHEKKRRDFNFKRYELSKKLPDIIRDFSERNCYHTGEKKYNYFTVEIVGVDGVNEEYEVYFNVSRSSRKGWMLIYIQSAYVRTEEYKGSRPKKRKMGLHVIAGKVQQGKKLNRR